MNNLILRITKTFTPSTKVEVISPVEKIYKVSEEDIKDIYRKGYLDGIKDVTSGKI